MTNLDDWLEDRLATLHCVYLAGNLGALNDVIYYCNKYKKPLPEWAAITTAKLIRSISGANDDNKTTNSDKEVQKWKGWYRQYKQDMADYECYETVLDVKNGEDCYAGEEDSRERKGVKWEPAYDIAGKIKCGEKLDNPPQLETPI